MPGKVQQLPHPMAKFLDRPYDTVWPMHLIHALDLLILDGPLNIVT